jgi:hypothetical protein
MLWGNTPPTSPVQEGWSGVPADATWPPLSNAVRPDGWPDLSLPSSGGVLVTMTTTIGEDEEHSACRCKGNLTDLRRILHLSLAKGNPK